MSQQEPSSLDQLSALSKHARHVTFPATITSTDWPWIEQISSRVGIEYEPWQKELGALITGLDENGLYASSIDGATISVCRQAGKTFLVSGICVSLALVRPKTLILWTAHHNATSAETFRHVSGVTSSPRIQRFMARPSRSPGRESINFRNGSRIKFGARSHGFGRGIPGVDVIVFDEAQILKQQDIDAMLP
ncbi:MAG: terminase family protein, partial [Propionibacteriaceae bacterium]|nr:terminase family protein [Propionibacteriaceae bacterium]